MVRRQLLAQVEAVWHVRADDVLAAVQTSNAQSEGEGEEKRDAFKDEGEGLDSESRGGVRTRGRADATRLVRILQRLVNRLAAGSGHGLLEFIDPRFDRLQFIPECVALHCFRWFKV